jgi:hypothetical protein
MGHPLQYIRGVETQLLVEFYDTGDLPAPILSAVDATHDAAPLTDAAAMPRITPR